MYVFRHVLDETSARRVTCRDMLACLREPKSNCGCIFLLLMLTL